MDEQRFDLWTELKEIASTRLFRTLAIFFIAFAVLAIWAVNRISESMSVNVSSPPAQVMNTPMSQPGFPVISLGNGMIGVVGNDPTRGSSYHQMMVFDFNTKTQKFDPVGVFDYSGYIQNPFSLQTLNVNH